MTRPIIRIHNSETDEIIDREMNDAELADYNKMHQILAQEKEDREAQALQRQALLNRLGITAEELKVLLG